MIEEADQHLWVALTTTQLPMQLIAELTRRPGTAPARGVRFDVMVQ